MRGSGHISFDYLIKKMQIVDCRVLPVQWNNVRPFKKIGDYYDGVSQTTVNFFTLYWNKFNNAIIDGAKNKQCQMANTPFELCHEQLVMAFRNKTLTRSSTFGVVAAPEYICVLEDLFGVQKNNIYLIDDGLKDGTMDSFKRDCVVRYGLLPSENVVYKENIDMRKIDFFVGNPPFQDDSTVDKSANLWSSFWKLLIVNSKPDAVIALITPTTWMTPSKDFSRLTQEEKQFFPDGRLWSAFDQFSSYACVDNDRIQKMFNAASDKPIGSTFGYVIVDKSGKAGLTFHDGIDCSDIRFRSIEAAYMYSVKTAVSTDTTITIAQFQVDQVCSPDLKVAIPLTKTANFEKLVQIVDGTNLPLDYEGKPVHHEYDVKANQLRNFLYIHVPNMEIAERVKETIIRNREILCNAKACRWVGYMNIKLVKMLKLWPYS